MNLTSNGWWKTGVLVKRMLGCFALLFSFSTRCDRPRCSAHGGFRYSLRCFSLDRLHSPMRARPRASFIIFRLFNYFPVLEPQCKAAAGAGTLFIDRTEYHLTDFPFQGDAAGILLIAPLHCAKKGINIFCQLRWNSSFRVVGGFPPIKGNAKESTTRAAIQAGIYSCHDTGLYPRACKPVRGQFTPR